MSQPLARLSAAFAAGAVGALVNSLAVQLAGRLRPGSAPALTPEWLCPRLVWGGIWGLLLVLPFLRDRPVIRGLLFSLAPSIARLTVFAGAPIPLVAVFVFNAIWKVAAALWYRSTVR